MPSPPPKPARELAGQASVPRRSSASFLHTPVPRRSSVPRAGPNTSTCSIGAGTGPVVEPIVALPNAFVGTPSPDGEKPARVIWTVSAPLAAAAPASIAPAHASPATTLQSAPILAPLRPQGPRSYAPACSAHATASTHVPALDGEMRRQEGCHAASAGSCRTCPACAESGCVGACRGSLCKAFRRSHARQGQLEKSSTRLRILYGFLVGCRYD